MRDYLNYISSPNDDRPLVTGFDEKTGRPYQGYDSVTGHIIEVLPTVVEAPAPVAAEAAQEPVEAEEAVSATPVAEAPVEAAVAPQEGQEEHVEEGQ